MRRPTSFASFQPTRLFVAILFFVFIPSMVSAQETAVLDWAKRMGGTGNDGGQNMALDAAGNIYTTGFFSGTADFDPGTGVFNMTSAGGNDTFISKLDANGNLVWAKSMGGTAVDGGAGIAVDASGNVYITGGFSGTSDFDPGAGTFSMTAATTGEADIFIAKLDANGDFVWVKGILGGTWWDNGLKIVVDSSGNVVVVGRVYFQGGARDFDPGAGIFLVTIGHEDAFILKLDTNGNFVWVKTLGGVDEDRGYSIALDATGNIYTTGYFESTADFDPGPGTFNMTAVGDWDVFISKLDGNGNFVWAKATVNSNPIYHSDGTYGNKIALDPSGNVYTASRYNGTVDFDPGAGIFNLTSVGGFDIYVSKLTNNGDFVWAKSMGGSGYDEALSVSLDATGDVYVSGTFVQTVDFDPGASTFNLTSAGSNDIFISKLDTDGNFEWARSMSGTGDDRSVCVALDAANNPYLTGWFQGTVDFDPGSCTYNLVSAGSNDLFIQKLRQTTILPAPTITSFTPSSGPVGTTVTITGTNFSTTLTDNDVKFFNNVTAIVTASTATSITITVPAGAVTGKVSVSVNCISVISTNDFTVTADPVITISSQPISTAVCDGAVANFTLTASGTTNLAYQWQEFNGTAFINISNTGGYSGTTTSTLTINTTGNFGAGDYQCSVSGDLATSVFSQTASLTFTTSTTLAEITVNGNIMTASTGDSYQWYQNDVLVVDATDQSFEFNVLEYGKYKVDVTDNGCTSTSAEFEYLITGFENLNEGIKLYPNPVDRILTAEYNPPYTITIINTNGSMVYKTNSNTRSTSIDFSSLATGVYFLQLKNEKGVSYHRITKK